METCIFCNVAKKVIGATPLLAKSRDVALFVADRPCAAKAHYLVISTQHIESVADLKPVDIPLLERMKNLGACS